MKEFLPWWIHRAPHAGTSDFYHAWAAQVIQVQNIFSLPYTICLQGPATQAGSRAGSPVSECVSTGRAMSTDLFVLYNELKCYLVKQILRRFIRLPKPAYIFALLIFTLVIFNQYSTYRFARPNGIRSVCYFNKWRCRNQSGFGMLRYLGLSCRIQEC